MHVDFCRPRVLPQAALDAKTTRRSAEEAEPDVDSTADEILSAIDAVSQRRGITTSTPVEPAKMDEPKTLLGKIEAESAPAITFWSDEGIEAQSSIREGVVQVGM